ncbi:MAG: SPOR domain-containing protein [Zoogloeaceae bacterium]|jgi:hypothetical protein|nr:SPOR domain-containing protein [Zoogloeaceae bacterium]
MRVPRTIFLLLVLGNLLLFAWGQGYFGAASGGETGRFAAQIEPGKLIVSQEEEAPPPREACGAFAGLSREAADKLAALLTGRDAELKIERRALTEPKAWWVHIPPQSSGTLADRKAAELARLGIKDSYVIRKSGPTQYAISLGLFKSEDGANEYLADLKKKGIKTARILAREDAGDKIVVEARGSADRLAAALADLPPDLAAARKTDCSDESP